MTFIEWKIGRDGERERERTQSVDDKDTSICLSHTLSLSSLDVTSKRPLVNKPGKEFPRDVQALVEHMMSFFSLYGPALCSSKNQLFCVFVQTDNPIELLQKNGLS